MVTKEQALEDWKEHFKMLEGRKPNYQEEMAFRVGFNKANENKSQGDEK